MDDAIEIYPWYPSGVQRIIATGSMNFVGLVDETTVLKYPHIKGESEGLDIERQIFQVLQSHPHIIEFKGIHEEGVLLGYACHGSIADYLQLKPNQSIQDKLRWSLQAAMAVSHIYLKGVIHCDISVGNLLLDEMINVKLCDFQGRLLQSDGTIQLDGGSSENTKSSMPRMDSEVQNEKTDIFALGSAIFYILNEYQPFPELDSNRDELEITRRSKYGEYPAMNFPAGEIIKKCWSGLFESAEDLVQELAEVKKTL